MDHASSAVPERLTRLPDTESIAQAKRTRRPSGAGPFVLALTGSIGCGKTTALEVFAEMGIPLIYLDVLGHALRDSPNPTYYAILDRFGHDLVDTPGGAIDIHRLDDKIFVNDTAKADFNAIYLPALRQALENELAKFADAKTVVFEAALLFEWRLEDLAHRIWTIEAPSEQQIAQVMTRCGVTREKAIYYISLQWSQAQKAGAADLAIMNDGDVNLLHARVREAFQNL